MFHNLATFLGFASETALLMLCHKFSIGLRSRVWTGHSINIHFVGLEPRLCLFGVTILLKLSFQEHVLFSIRQHGFKLIHDSWWTMNRLNTIVGGNRPTSWCLLHHRPSLSPLRTAAWILSLGVVSQTLCQKEKIYSHQSTRKAPSFASHRTVTVLAGNSRRSLIILELILGWAVAILVALPSILMVVFGFLPRVSGFALHFQASELTSAEEPTCFAPLYRFFPLHSTF